MSKSLVVLLLAAAMPATVLSACLPMTTSPGPKVTAPAQDPAVLQRTATLTIAPDAIASSTATCASGETMVSGGWSTASFLPANALGVLASYPSASTGAQPLTQGQTETSWTVRAINPTTAALTYVVTVNCLVGLGTSVINGVWFQEAQSASCGNCVGNQASVSVPCPDSTSALSGGGFNYQPFGAGPGLQPYIDSSLGAVDGNGDWAWGVEWWLGRATGYAVCVTAARIIPAPSVTVSNTPPVEATGGHYQSDVDVSCPSGDLLVGGGFLTDNATVDPNFLGSPLTTDVFTPGGHATWQVGFDNTATPGLHTYQWSLDAIGQCIEISSVRHILITFSNYHHLLRIPADVVVATDGTGPVKATLLSANVSQAQSAAIDAATITNPITGGVSYQVPAACGDPWPAITAATAALTGQLKRALPASQVAFGSPSVNINRGSLTCSPSAGTQRTSPFTYTQAIDGSASQSAYNPADVLTFQVQQLQRGAAQLGNPYALGNVLVCPFGPVLLSATEARATVECAVFGVAEWRWSDQALRALATQLAGKTQRQALALLNGTPGIESGSATIRVPGPATVTDLPTNPDQITLLIALKQDTAPVVRTP